jgi:hypothetical protein
MRARTIAAATVAGCLMASAPAQANQAVNGGFEQPDIATASWSTFESILGWTPTNTCGIEVQELDLQERSRPDASALPTRGV